MAYFSQHRQPASLHSVAKSIQIFLAWTFSEVWQFRQYLKQISIGLKAVSLCSLHQRIDDRTGIRALRRITEQPIFSAERKWPDGILRKVVGNVYFAVVEECAQIRLLVPGISNCFRQFAPGNRIQGFHPAPIGLKQGLHPHLTRRFSFCIAQSGILLLCGKELIAVIVSYGGFGVFFRRSFRHGLPPFPPHMRPASASHHAFYLIVSGVAICYQATVKPFQKNCCVFAAAARLVFKISDRFAAAVIAGIDPHPRF